MSLVIALKQISESVRTRVGGKAHALSRMAASGLHVPDAFSITTDAYERYVDATGLRERILLELHRKDFKDMRWEEIWDAALRIRNMFLKTAVPKELSGILKEAIESFFSESSVVVRSSAPGEDSAKASFAGLHESYVNVRGADRVLEHVQKVWASLWSDAALLYRQELGLDVEKSSMAVLVQEIVAGERSGVVFGKNPNDPSQAVIEAVYGLNQGLVDGAVEPDRWLLDRESGRVITHTAGRRDKLGVPSQDGVRFDQLDEGRSRRNPLSEDEIGLVFALAREAEDLFGTPQDVEWTFLGEVLYALQARPITKPSSRSLEDERPWYLSLRRGFENLKSLRRKIEDELIPAMVEESSRLARQDLSALSDAALADEIARREAIHDKWVKVYWRDFIPFAHGTRLFGQVYNDTVLPADPYEFVDLLGDTEMVSVSRNRNLEDMAVMVRENPGLRDLLDQKRFSALDEGFLKKLDDFVERFEDLSCGTNQCFQGRETIVQVVLEMASGAPREREGRLKETASLRRAFLSHFQGAEREEAEELLDLARTSYRLRDDDNIYLGKIEGQLTAAVQEGRRRLRGKFSSVEDFSAKDVVQALRNPAYVPPLREAPERKEAGFEVKPRQLVGQPAGPGVSKGMARVILEPEDLLDFKSGEILVCDALDPNMTFVVPLASGIIERRGGMLIHGAIIAREYGLPCVTGIPDATVLIRTGDIITLDGYLGIAVIERRGEI
jgi:phosphohistidine swiveling domain-containing protein